MRIILAGLLGAIVVVMPTFAQSQAAVRVLRVGTFLIDPPRLPVGERWFSLQRTGNEWALVRVTPRATPVKAICGDRATEISTDRKGEFQFLIAGAASLSEGSVTTTIPRARLLYPGEAVDISIRPGDGYELQALGRAIREVGGVVFENYELWIHHGQQAQVVASFERNGAGHPRQVVWSGDIDGDLRPDVLFDFPLGDAGANYVLFLSSAGTGEQLVSQVSTFATPGC